MAGERCCTLWAGLILVAASVLSIGVHGLSEGHRDGLQDPVYQSRGEWVKYQDRRLRLFDMVEMFLTEHGEQARPRIQTVISKLQKGGMTSQMTGHQPLVCQNTDQCSANRQEMDWVQMYQRADDLLKMDDSQCTGCMESAQLLQDAACVTPWEVVRDALIVACEDLFEAVGIDTVMCNGTVTLQGEHLYCIVQELTARELCESLDSCFPPPVVTRQAAPVAERTPWAVKEQVQAKYRQRLAKMTKRRPKRQTDILKVVQLTDIHIQPAYAVGSPADCTAFVCCTETSKPQAGAALARQWGEWMCNLPERTMRVFLKKTNILAPDLILYAGDNPPHTMWDETLESQLNCSNIVVNAMKEEFDSAIPVYPAIGNHEMFPTNLYSNRMLETTTMNPEFTKMWKDIAQFSPTNEQTFTDMSMYSKLHEPGLRILALNTLYDWYTANFYNGVNTKDVLNQQLKDFVEQTLSDARTNLEKVIIVGHHPTGSGHVRANRWWHDVATEYRDVIVLHVSGHTHLDHFHLNVDAQTNEAATVNLVSAVMTGNAYNNPTARVFELDRSNNYQVLDYSSYYIRLDAQYPDQEPEIRLNYNAKDEYNLADMSADAWQDLVTRFIDDDVLFRKWINNRHADVDTSPCSDDCDESCKTRYLCEMWFPSADEYEACLEGTFVTSAPSNPTAAPTTGGVTTAGSQPAVILLASLALWVLT